MTDKEIQKALDRLVSQRQIETTSLTDAFKTTGASALSMGRTLLEVGGQALGTFQDISKSGASFSGDILGMGKAALNSRVSMQEFATIIKENAPAFAGLGGNVTRGAEAFSKLSKAFFDDRSSGALRDLGYTSKELNDVLALTVGMQKASYKDDETGRKRSIEAAQNLAIEMDAIAKLTGKSREAQMEEMKKAGTDGRVEAKFRLMSAGKSEDEIAKMKLDYAKGLAQAQANGTTEMYKQFFATGTYNTKQAATQSALLGQQTRAMEQQIKAMQRGDFAAAAEARSRVDAEAVKNGNSRILNGLATFGDAIGPAGSIAQKNLEVTDAMYQSVTKVAQANGILLTTQQDYAKALRLTLEDIKAAQGGRRAQIDDKTGKPVRDDKGNIKYEFVGGSGQAAVSTQMAYQDTRSAAATVGERAAREAVNTTGAEGSDSYRRNQPLLRLERAGVAGLGPAPSPTDEQGRPKPAAQIRQESGGITGSVAASFRDSINILANAVKGLIPRSTGSLGTTGSLIENFGKGQLAMLHGKEGVITEDQLKNIALGMKQEGVSGAINSLMGAMPKEMRGNPTGGMDGFDLSSISKKINTTFSTVSGGGETTTSRKQSAESSGAEKEMSALTKKFREDFEARKKVLVEGMAVEDRKYSNIQKVLKADEVAMKLREDFYGKQAEIQKKINAGISYETTKKEEQLAVTKKISTEELAAKKVAAGKFDPNINDGGKAHRVGEREFAEKFAAEGNIRNLAKLNADFDKALGIKSPTATTTSAAPSTPAAKPTTTSAAPSTPAAKPTTAPISAIGAAERMLGIKTKTAEIPKAVKDATTKTAEETAATAAANKPKPGEPTTAKPPVSSKDATLNDVVSSLNMLNKQMGQLLSQQQDIGARQIKATKSNGSNIYAR